MRSLRTLSLLASFLTLPITVASAASNWSAAMSGASEVPPNPAPSTGTFEATLNDAQDRMDFTLTYHNLTSAMKFAHIHRAPVGVNGSIIYFLAATARPSPFTGCTDPTPAGPTNGDCGFSAADVADLQAGNLYANLHTDLYPGGEIRGQILSAVPVAPKTWGRMKSLFR